MAHTHNILIVDDEPRMCDSLKILLGSNGYETQTGHSGQEALHLLARNNFDLVLLDIVMPDMNGLQIMDRINSQHPETSVIVVTGHASVDSAIESLRKGAYDYLKKPFEFEELLRRVKNALDQKRLKKQYEIINGKLQLSERRYQYLVDNSPDIIYTLDSDGIFTYVNPAWEKILGHKGHEIMGKRFVDFARKEDVTHLLGLFKRVKDGGETITDASCKLVCKDGSDKVFIMSGAPNLNSQDEVDGVVGVFKDITTQRKLESQLMHAQKMEAIGTLAGGIAHDFNNLLMGIQGRASLMALHVDSDHPHFDHLRGLEDMVQSGAGLTRQLLGFARGGKYEVKSVDLNELIRKSSHMFGRTKKEIRTHTSHEQDTLTVEADPGQIEQVLLNLYVNAWQAMEEGGGDLSIKTENIVLHDEDVRPFGLEPGKYARISVTDTGIGMDEATQKRIFEPFFTTKKMGRGTGLGLASAYGIIKNHGGIINVNSEKGGGTTFDIYLPASERKVMKEKQSSTQISRGIETILLVDDENMILEVGEEILEEMGYRVLCARGGKEAVETYQERNDGIDMVILDMIMPDMGGGETYDRMKQINPQVKVLLSSGYSIDGEASHILERGCDGFIQKPFAMQQLSSCIRKVLDT